jgi:hypothetical protein
MGGGGKRRNSESNMPPALAEGRRGGRKNWEESPPTTPHRGGLGSHESPEGNVTRRGGPGINKRRAERQPARRRRTPHPGWGEC